MNLLNAAMRAACPEKVDIVQDIYNHLRAYFRDVNEWPNGV